MSKTIVLVYSGGLDTSVCIPMMKEDYGYDHVVTVTVDVGQPADDVRIAAEKAEKLGTEHYTIDVKKEFVEDYIYPTIKANGDYQGYPISTSIARPLIGAKAVEVARKVGSSAFCHGCTGKGNDQFRIELALRTMMPEASILAPMRERNLTRSEEIEYAKVHGIPIGQSLTKIWSIDENLWGRSIEGGLLEDPNYAPPEEIYQWTKSLEDSPDKPRILTIGFENGVPVSLDGEKLSPMALVAKAHEIAGEYGIGRIDIMEDRMLGLKVRENYECPAASLLIPAHKALEELVLTRDERFFKMQVDAAWGRMAYEGLWWDPLKTDLDAFIDKTQERVTGDVRVRLFKGAVKVVGRTSPWALYSEELASFDDKSFDQAKMEGAVAAHGLQGRMFWSVKNSK